jgi:HSP20 family molecular chaperone IbpA
MVDEYYPGKYLAEIVKKCRQLTVAEMLNNVEEVRRKNKLGFGHYLFDGRHAPTETWSIPGALEYEIIQGTDAVEVLFRAGHFEKEELSVIVEEGMLEVRADHVEEDTEGDEIRKVKVTKSVPVPFDFDLDDVGAKFEKDVLVVRIPKPTKPRRKVEIE